MTKILLSCAIVAVALMSAGCGGSNTAVTSSTPAATSSTGGATKTISAAEQLSLDVYGANVVVADVCGAIVNDSNPRDVRALSHAVDDLIDFHRDADNAEPLRLLRERRGDAARLLRLRARSRRHRRGRPAHGRCGRTVEDPAPATSRSGRTGRYGACVRPDATRSALEALEERMAIFGDRSPSAVSLERTRTLAEDVAAGVAERERIAEEEDRIAEARHADAVRRDEQVHAALLSIQSVLVAQAEDASRREEEALAVARGSHMWARIAGVASIVAIIVSAAALVVSGGG